MKKKLLAVMLVTAMLVSDIAPAAKVQAQENRDISVVMLSTGVNATESGKLGQNVTYTLDAEGTLMISGSGETYDYSESDSPFSLKTVKKIMINEGVTRLGDFVFSGCNSVADIEIPDSVTSLGEYAFGSWKSLESITLPQNLVSIGRHAFSGCDKLTSMKIPASVKQIGAGVFEDCFKLASIEVEENNQKFASFNGSLYTKDLTEIHTLPLANTNITFSKNLKRIGAEAFRGHRWKSVEIPKGVVSIGDGAFEENDLTSIKIPNGVTSIGKDAFCWDTELSTIEIPDSVTRIGEGAFSFTGVTSIRIPCSVKKIEKGTFEECGNLNLVEIPEGVTEIAEGAFYDCCKLKSIMIPKTVQKIGKAAVGYVYEGNDKDAVIQDFILYCYSNTAAEIYAKENGIQYELRKEVAKKSISQAKVSLFEYNLAYTGKVQKPEVTSVKLGNITLKSCDYTVSYKNNTNIGTASVVITGRGNYTGIVTKSFKITAKKGSAFTAGACKYKITGSASVALAGLKSSKTTKVTIPGTVKIGGKIFKVTSVANNALKRTKVTSVTVGNNVTTIGTSAFESCEKLTKVTTGTGITKIEANAFKNCKKLDNITIKSVKLKSVGKNALKNIKATAQIKVPAKKLSAYRKLLQGKGQDSRVKIVK